MRVLIAEDSPLARRILREAVEALGHTCLEAADGAAAWALYRQAGADVIISDWLMPGLDGPELCRRVRAHTCDESCGPHPPYTYFILLTMLEDKQHAVEGMQAGADDYLVKPLNRDDLRLRLIAASRVTALHQELEARRAEALRRVASREALLRLARRFAAEGNLDHLLTALLEEAVAALGAENGNLMRWDEARGQLVTARTRFAAVAAPPVLAAGQGAAGRAVAQRAPVVVDNYQQVCAGETPAAAAGAQAAAAAPMLYEGRVLGAIAVISFDAAKRFTAEDADVLELLASTGAAALVGLERARLDGVLLAVRTLEHELNNKLTLTVGYTEIIGTADDLPPRLRPAASAAHRGARDAAHIVQQLRQVIQLQETSWGAQVGTTIDLDESTR
ncbi:MAG TPA: response regulator [Chloroflexota bacterium]|nr:response regulator [Chloroflexota bacterium]